MDNTSYTIDNPWYPARMINEFNPDRFEFRWNEDYTEFQLVPVRWWDDLSYIRYQSEDLDE